MPAQLPPLNALRAFESAARHLSFTLAAEELHVTQSAVSHQLRTLEGWLGFALFERKGQRLLLTHAGRRYSASLSAAFASMIHATQDLITTGSHQILNLRGYGMFFSQWLIPRLAGFHEMHPDIKVRLTTHVEAVDFQRDDADMGIVYGTGPWDGLRSDLVVGDVLVALAAPRLLSGLGPEPALDAVLALPMLHSRRRAQWDDWLAATGTARQLSERDMYFEDVSILYQCALQGLGVALLQARYVEKDLTEGRLQKVHPFALERAGGYYLVGPEETAEVDKVARFRRWLVGQAGG
jgi:LysR family glycine cleavage system transcriptional activator